MIPRSLTYLFSVTISKKFERSKMSIDTLFEFAFDMDLSIQEFDCIQGMKKLQFEEVSHLCRTILS